MARLFAAPFAARAFARRISMKSGAASQQQKAAGNGEAAATAKAKMKAAEEEASYKRMAKSVAA